MIRITECPRDAMQGIKKQIPTSVKAEYINMLLKVGFDIIDFGSFVSPKAIPQLADTSEVYNQLDFSVTTSKLLAIVANERGAEQALKHSKIDYLGFPFSVSPTFQRRNTNQDRKQALKNIKQMDSICKSESRDFNVYISMAFGNPYKDEWSPDLVNEAIYDLVSLGVNHIALADTIACASITNVGELFSNIFDKYPEVSFSAHFHPLKAKARELVEAALKAGCESFDTSINGIGGCPMAKDELVGNLATEDFLTYVDVEKLSIDLQQFSLAQKLANNIFSEYK